MVSTISVFQSSCSPFMLSKHVHLYSSLSHVITCLLQSNMILKLLIKSWNLVLTYYRFFDFCRYRVETARTSCSHSIDPRGLKNYNAPLTQSPQVNRDGRWRCAAYMFTGPLWHMWKARPNMWYCRVIMKDVVVSSIMNFKLEDASQDVYVWGINFLLERERTLMLPPAWFVCGVASSSS